MLPTTKARQLIDGGIVWARCLKGHRAWSDIVANFRDDPADSEKGRIRLAEALLSVAPR